MGEIVEINIISEDKKLFDKLNSYILKYMNGHKIKKNFEIMDNWEYDNEKKVTSIEMAKEYIGKKIVCITNIGENGKVGMTVESQGDLLLYNVWLDLLYDNNSNKLMYEFIEYLSEQDGVNNIYMGAIGVETKFDYITDCKTTIKNSHNIDVWVIEKKDMFNNLLDGYKVFKTICCGEDNKEIYILLKKDLPSG